MKHLSLLAILLLGPCARGQEMWYRQPASKWVDALPVGNGRLGGMVFGGIGHERIQFNEATVWTGEPHDYAHPGAYRHLAAIRNLLFEGKQAEAETLAMAGFMSVPVRQKAYQAFGEILLDYPDIREGGVTGYRRSLDLETAVASTEYKQGDVTYRREVFASYPANAIVVRLSASRPGSLTFEANLQSAHAGATIAARQGGEISMSGAVADSAIRYEARLVVEIEGGRREAHGATIAVTGANTATLELAGATNFRNYRDVSADPVQRNSSTIGPSARPALCRDSGIAPCGLRAPVSPRNPRPGHDRGGCRAHR